MEKNLHLIGAGGGKPKKQEPPVEAKNTLRSVSKGRILDLVGYGPIKGPVDGLKSIFPCRYPCTKRRWVFEFLKVSTSTSVMVTQTKR